MSYNEWLDIDVLEDYLDGKLDAKTMYKVERLSLEDPFVAEALAGLSQSPRRSQSLSLLQKQLQERIAQKPIEKKRWTITSQRLSIGAAAAVLFVTASVLFWMKNSQPKINANAPKTVQLKIAPEVKTNPETKPIPPIQLDLDKAVVVAKTNRKAKNNNPAVAAKPTTMVAAAAAEPALAKAIEQADARQEVLAKAQAQAAEKEESKVAVASALAGRVAGVQVDKTDAKSISGIVIAKEDGKPIPGAAVRLTNSNVKTTTNAKGEFTLPLDSAGNTNQQVSVAYLGYSTKNVSAGANQNLNVVLEPDSHYLSEVVIVGYGEAKNKKRDFNDSIGVIKRAATPEGGWESFYSYLKNNNKLFKAGVSDKTVMLSFEVLNGRPTNIKVIGGLTRAENKEAIRLLNEGPNWIMQEKTNTKATVNISF